MEYYDQSFDTTKLTNGQLITLSFTNGGRRSGVVTNVTSDTITYSYFDEVAGGLQTSILSIEQLKDGSASFVVTKHLRRVDKSSEETKQKTSTFFDALKQMKNIDSLVRAFKYEDAQTLALIASYLNPKTRVEFLYRLPDDIFQIVNKNLDNVTHIQKDILHRLENQLGEKFKQYKENEKKEEETHRSQKQAQQQSQNPFDLFGGLLGGLNPEDLFKQLGNNKSEQPPLPNPEQLKEMMEGMLENMPKMLNDLLGGLNDEDDDDDHRKF